MSGITLIEKHEAATTRFAATHEQAWGDSITERPTLDGESYSLKQDYETWDWLPCMDEGTLQFGWWKMARGRVCMMNAWTEDERVEDLRMSMLQHLADMKVAPDNNWHMIWSAMVLKGQMLGCIDGLDC